MKIFIDHTPLGRAGKPEDIVGPAMFLASDLSGYVTGSIVMAEAAIGRFSVDAGYSKDSPAIRIFVNQLRPGV